MAKPTTQSSTAHDEEEIPPAMDYAAHNTTYRGFTQTVKWTIIISAITMVALSHASTQFGPRVLTNFMSDRGNTVTLGTFIATFLYCLMVLRTIRGGEDDFVPQLSVVGALLLAACSIAVLIYFINHVSQSIHISHVVARIGEQLVEDASKRFPDLIGHEPDAPRVPPPLPDSAWGTVRSREKGYLQAIDQEQLMKIATKRDVVIRLRYRPGDFVMEGRGLAGEHRDLLVRQRDRPLLVRREGGEPTLRGGLLGLPGALGPQRGCRPLSARFQ